MTEEESKTMDRYGVTQKTNITFHFAGHKYQRLEDAVNYAKKNQHVLTPTNSHPKGKT